MPVTLTAIGDVLDVTIVDDNFSTIEDLLKAGLVASDFDCLFTRYNVRKFVQGQLVSSYTKAREPQMQVFTDLSPKHSDSPYLNGEFDITFRHKKRAFNDNDTYPSDFPEDADLGSYHMELLGFPGPSFFFDWQEEGRPEPTGAAGWPPASWPYNRYPDGHCYSQWVTVPGASTRMFVPKPALAKVTAHAVVSQNMFRYLCMEKDVIDNASPATDSLFNCSPAAKHGNVRWFNFSRFGLFVDTNPHLFDEFINDNPNIDSDYVSWKKFVDRTLMMPQRATVRLQGYVPLAGNRHYNFAMKNRCAAIKGSVIAGTWSSGFFESTATDYGHRDGNWKADWATKFGRAVGVSETKFAWYPNFISLWDSTSISVELMYGRTATAYDSTDTDIEAKSGS